MEEQVIVRNNGRTEKIIIDELNSGLYDKNIKQKCAFCGNNNPTSRKDYYDRGNFCLSCRLEAHRLFGKKNNLLLTED